MLRRMFLLNGNRSELRRFSLIPSHHSSLLFTRAKVSNTPSNLRILTSLLNDPKSNNGSEIVTRIDGWVTFRSSSTTYDGGGNPNNKGGSNNSSSNNNNSRTERAGGREVFLFGGDNDDQQNQQPQRPLDDSKKSLLKKIWREAGSGGRIALRALGGNTIILVGKTLAWWITGSTAMLAETVHSLADILNQALLLVGIRLSSRSPDQQHPYGYASDRYIWALISAVGVFFLGSAVSLWNGISGLMHPHLPESLAVALFVLGLSLVADGYIFIQAWQSVLKQAKKVNMGIMEFIREGPVDPLALSVLAEDGSSIIGNGTAALFLALSYTTMNPIYDPLGSVCIGGVLGLVALSLIHINRKFLLGRSIHPRQMARIMAVLETDPLIKSVHDVKGVRVGTNTLRFKAELRLDGEILAKQYLHRVDIQQLFLDIKSPADLDKFLLRYGVELINLLGDEIDRIEQGLRDQVPEIVHCDLEIL